MFGNASGTSLERLEAVYMGIIKAGLDNLDWFALYLEFWAAASTAALQGRLKQQFDDLYTGMRTLLADLIVQGQENGEFQPEADAQATLAHRAPVQVAGQFGLLVIRKLALQQHPQPINFGT